MGSAQGKACLRSKEVWGGIKKEYGAKHSLVAEDGDLHKKLRKAFQPSFAKGALRGRYQEMLDLTDKEIDRRWETGAEVPVVWAFQRMATHQLGDLSNDFVPEGYEDDIRVAIRNMIMVRAIKVWPEFMAHLPGYKRSRARFHTIGTKLIERYHERQANNFEGRRTLIDDVMEIHLADPELIPESDLVLIATSPYVAGLDTVANTIGCMLYEILAQPDVVERIQAEVDAVFDRDEVISEDELTPKVMPVLHRAMLETLRLHPIAPLSMRVANEDFVFDGVQIKEGQMMYIGYTVCHYMEEFFPDPMKFDVNRPVTQYKIPGAFTPYSRGAHTCLGKTLAEVQMMLTMARLFYRLDMSLQEGYVFKKQTFPTPGPDKHFKVKINGRRH
jgi:cytochrome P450